MELFQLIGVFPGTFDFYDLLVESTATVIALFFVKRNREESIQKMKRVYKTLLILVVITIFALMAIGSDTEGIEKAANDAQQAGSDMLDSLSDSNDSETEEVVPITYNRYTAKDLLKDLEDNAMRAEENHKGEYVEIDGYLGSIDSSGKHFDIDPSRDSFILTSITCYVKTEEQKQALMDLNKGDHIIVKGKITRVGEFLGYSVDIESIAKK